MPQAIWKGNISFGLVSVPIVLQTAERRSELSFNLLDRRNHARIRYERVNDQTGEPVPWNEIVKAYEYDDNDYVMLTPADFKAAAVEATQTIDTRRGFGALLLGVYEDGGLKFAGRVGTGFTVGSLMSLLGQLRPLETPKPPFSDPPSGADARGVHWVRPELVAEVEFTEWTREGILRHPSFKGLRMDKTPKEVVRERPEPPEGKQNRDRKGAAEAGDRVPKSKTKNSKNRGSKIEVESPRRDITKSPHHQIENVVAGIMLTNPDRVLYPEENITKCDLALFYEEIAEWVMPHVAGRPVALFRCPAGRQGECFFQKHLTERSPKGISGVAVREKSQTRNYVVIDDLAGLIGLVQMGVLELHPWGCRADNVEKPDRLIFDLDPGPGAPWCHVIDAARQLHDRLADLGLQSFVKTSGGKGLHVVAPIARRVEWDDLKSFARSIAAGMAREQPDRYLTTMAKARRPGKIFLDYLRNGRGATCVAAYTTRAREGAPVSAPLAWEELSVRLSPTKYNVRNLGKRLGAVEDPWKGFFNLRQAVSVSAIRQAAAQ